MAEELRRILHLGVKTNWSDNKQQQRGQRVKNTKMVLKRILHLRFMFIFLLFFFNYLIYKMIMWHFFNKKN